MVLVKKLYRSRDNKMLSGLCGGIGELTNVDATLFRILLVILLILSGGGIILVYIIVSMVIPKTPHFPNSFQQHRPPNMNGYNRHDHMNNQNGYGNSFQTNHHNQPNPTPPHWGQGMNHANPNQASGSNLDQMMEDLEKKALKREIDELKNKISKMEKGE